MLQSLTLRTVIVLLFSTLSTAAFAQRPQSTFAARSSKGSSIEYHGNLRKMPCTSDAGSVTGFRNFQMQSTSFGANPGPGSTRSFAGRPDTIFLCFDDQFEVDYAAGSEDLSGDPNPATDPAIGFAVYECTPTVPGDMLSTIYADPCVADNGVYPAGDPFFDSLTTVIGFNYQSGDYDIVLINDEVGGLTIPNLYNGLVDPDPVVFDYAPITLDTVSSATRMGGWEDDVTQTNNLIGPCVKVATNYAFTVAYLNPLEATPQSSTFATCTGSFTIEGGAPELRGNNGYTVVVENTVTGQRATLDTDVATVGHTGVVNYTVPDAGMYRIIITDDISCQAEVQTVVHQQGCPPDDLKIILPFGTGLTGENNCYPVTVENFSDIVGFGFLMTFDPNVLSFTNITNINPGLTASIAFNGPPSSGGSRDEGNIRFLYEGTFTGPSDLPDGAVLFELCFDILGAVGEHSDLVFVRNTSTGVYSRSGGNIDLPLQQCDGLISVTDQPFPIAITPTDETCVGTADGTITATASGAPGPFIYSIRRTSSPADPAFRDTRTVTTDPATTVFSGLTNGAYEVRAEAANGTISIIPAVVDLGLGLAVNIDLSQRPTCFGQMNGEVTAEVIADFIDVENPVAAGYTFTWGGFPTVRGPVLSNIGAGSYSVTVTAPNGVCTSTAIANLPQPVELVIRPDNPSDAVVAATCSGAPDGTIAVSATGGVGPYDFFWPAGLGDDINVSMASRNNLLPGVYSITVVDNNGCETQETYAVNARKTLLINETIGNISCFGEVDGFIEVNGSATGAAPVGNFFVSLRNDATGVIGPEREISNNTLPERFTGLGAGNYTVLLRDEDPAGCMIREQFTILEPSELIIDDTPVSLRNETCTVGMDGRIEIAVSGGTQPYTYEVVNDSLADFNDTIVSGPLIDGLQADSNYLFIVEDASGCTDSLRFQILAPASAQIEPIAPVTVSCPGDTDATITANILAPVGETIVGIEWLRLAPDSTILGTLSSTSATISDLGVGLYGLRVTSSNDCVATAIAVVTSPGEVTLPAYNLISPTCPGDADGSIQLFPDGGTTNADGSYNYEYSFSPGTIVTDSEITNLAAGSYSVTITDANNCQPPFDTTFVLQDRPAIIGQFVSTPVSCPDDDISDGSATFTGGFSDGSSGNFDFVWSTGETTTGASSSTVSGLPRGEISVTVTDGTCSMTFTDTIASPDEFTTALSVEPASCNGNADGSATLVVTGGTGEYTFDWSASPETDNSIYDLAAGTGYEVRVTDENGCSPAPLTFSVSEPDVLDLQIDPAQSSPTVTCAGDADGRITVFVNSVNNNDLGDNPYTWSGNVGDPSSPVADGLAPGLYAVTVTDVNGCMDSVSYAIGEPDPIEFSVLPIEEPMCFGETTQVFIDTAFGGSETAPDQYTFSINNDGFRIPIDQPGLVFAGNVTVSVFDVNGCSADSEPFIVNQPPEIIIALEDEITIELGDSLIRLNPIVSPVGDIYEYAWTPMNYLEDDSIRNPRIFPFNDQLYQLQVTNANMCTATAEIYVNVDANRNVYIPNAFSPNADGRNDVMRVFACQGVIGVSSVQVFNRWGGLVYEAENLPPDCLDGIALWDGLSAGDKPVNSGVFVYVVQVDFLDGVSLTYRGDVNVLR